MRRLQKSAADSASVWRVRTGLALVCVFYLQREIAVANELALFFSSSHPRVMGLLIHRRTTIPWRRELDGIYSSSSSEEQQDDSSL